MPEHRRGGATPVMSRPDTASWLAGVGVALCLVLTWVSRAALNTDGVAYLDLARRVHAGDWNGFVQGYWSPLLPALVTILSAPTGRAPTTLVTLAHVVNGAGAIAGLTLL